MKKYLLLLLLALSITILSACTKDIEDTIIEEEVSDEKENNLPYPNVVENLNYSYLKDIDLDTTKKDLSTEEIMELYDLGSRVSFMFNVCTPQTDPEDKIERTHPTAGFVLPYNRSKDFKTYEEFKNYVETLFNDKLSSEYLSSGQFIEYDGMLYIAEAGRGTNIFALEPDTYKITKEENKITICIATPFADENPDIAENLITSHYEYNDFVLEYINNMWKFTSFPVIR